MEFCSIGSTHNQVGGDQINVNNYYQVPSASSSTQRPHLRPFIDAPVDILSIHFTGRKEELQHIKEIFDADSGDVPIRCVIHGMHGIGKSQLALYFAKSAFKQGRYPCVLWISATTVEKLQRGIIKLLDLVDHKDLSHLDQDTRLTATRRWLEECDANWLLILDNVELDALEFLQEHLPRQNKRGNILFTTRTENLANTLASSAGQQHRVLELHSPGVQDAVKLLLRHVKRDADDAITSTAQDIARCVGCLPLAIAQAGSFVKETGTSLDKMLNLYKSEHKIEVCYVHIITVLPTLIIRLKVMSWENKLSNYEVKSVAATFTSQLEDLGYRSPDSSNLLKLLSFLDPESISLDMILQGAEAFSNPHQITNNWLMSSDITPLVGLIRSPVGLPSAITQLQNRSLVKRQDGRTTSTLHIHDLVQYMVQENVKVSGGARHWFEFAVQLIANAFACIEDPELPQYWTRCEIFISHIRSLMAQQEMYGSRKTWNSLVKVNQRVSNYLHSRGWYSEAEALLGRLLASKEQVLGSQHIDTLQTKHTPARVYQSQGRHKVAETIYEHVLVAREKHLGVEHPDTLKTMNNLAIVYESQGRNSDAERMHERVLAVRQKHLGVEHPDTLITMGNLGGVHQSLGRYGDTEDMFRRVLVAQQKHLGVEHPHTLLTMGNLGIAYQVQERYGDAEDVFRRVLVTQQKHLGVEHPETLKSMGDLANVYRLQYRYRDAEDMFRRVLVARQKHLGVEHPDTLWTMGQLALVYRSLSRYSDAERMHERVLAVRQKHLGVEHPDTLITMGNLASVHQSLGRYDDAEDMFRRVLVTRQKHLGVEHPHTLRTMGNLADVYRSQGRHSDAETMDRRAQAARRRNV
jgi:tetratricopeptide (TPR) repeat protein